MIIDEALVGQVRLLTADVAADEAARILTDDQVQGFLDLNDANVRRAAADALDAIAISEALVSKVIRTQDLATDGAKVAAALQARAAQLRAQADAADVDAGDVFEVVEFRGGCGPELAGW